MILVYDCETTGLPDFKAPSEAPHQPHLVQVAALLVDPTDWSERASFHAIVKPEGWTIPAEVVAVHGITTERAAAIGIPEKLAVSMVKHLWELADLRIAHNQGFDARILRIALLRHGSRELADRWKDAPGFCTADAFEPLCRLPPTDRMKAAGRGDQFKRPKLVEALKWATGTDLEGAHDAMADTRACLRLYRYLAENGRLPRAEKAPREAAA